MKQFLIIVIGLWTFSVDAIAQSVVSTGVDADSVRLSLLTCAPGKKEIYSLFGHTAVRYEYPKKHIDLVFNYGIFDFGAPHFIWRFVKGETDYLLGVTEYQHFVAEYVYYNRSVWQQTLNLTSEEKRELAELLVENARPENRIYRYSFLYDNCATRPRDKIEECLNDKIHYISSDKGRTFRDIIYEHTSANEWARFGMDFCLGPEVDRRIDDRQKMFVPLYLMSYFASATIMDNDGGNERPLVSGTRTLVEEEKTDDSGGFPLNPFQAALLLLLIVACITACGLKKQKHIWGVDVILFSAAGLCGCLVAFLTFFSEHPAVSPNYLIFMFHPLHILCLPWVIRREIKGQRSLYHLLNIVVLTLFMLLWVIIPQRINLAVLPLALCLLMRSANSFMLSYKRAK
ncbi:hypothetical protein EZS27_003052 [termite gut metagenome]|uniref:Uncharacterized protein n=1 Tax=termite gut metagenome TaxID=433724 RepID=A0A5J4SVN3_9ZZZZ